MLGSHSGCPLCCPKPGPICIPSVSVITKEQRRWKLWGAWHSGSLTSSKDSAGLVLDDELNSLAGLRVPEHKAKNQGDHSSFSQRWGQGSELARLPVQQEVKGHSKYCRTAVPSCCVMARRPIVKKVKRNRWE